MSPFLWVISFQHFKTPQILIVKAKFFKLIELCYILKHFINLKESFSSLKYEMYHSGERLPSGLF